MYVDFEDELTGIDETGSNITTGYNFTNYKKKLAQYLNDHLDHLVIHKIRHNEKLTEFEKAELENILFNELGNNQEYRESYGDKTVMETVRSIVGLDKETADNIFNKYINDNRLNMKQIEFVKRLKEYVIVNGTIEMEALMEQPFTMIGSVAEVFEDNITVFRNIKQDLDEINEDLVE